jgi:hypothetical protein
VEILRACDLSDARQYIRNKQVLVDVERKLSASALNTHVTIAHAKAVAAFAARLADPAAGSLEPLEIEARAQERVDRAMRIRQQVSAILPVLKLLRLNEDLSLSSLPALRLAPLAANQPSRLQFSLEICKRT